MDGIKRTTLIALIIIVYVAVIIGTAMYLLSDNIEIQRENDRMPVTTIPDVMMTFWELNETEDIYIIEGRVLNATINPAKRIEDMPLHTITIEGEDGNAHTIWMIFDMEPNTYFRRYHNPIIYDYYVQFVVQDHDYEEQQIYRCFYYRQLYEYT